MKRTAWNKGLGTKKYCIDCKDLLPVSSRYLPVSRCRKCYMVSRYTNFKAHPNSLKALKPKSKEWLQEHKIHLGHTHSKESLRKISNSRKGKALRENNPRWNNGERITSNGYKSILVKTSSPHKLEHRLVMEQELGRELTSNEIVHHVDHNKLNNDINNLRVMKRSEHSSLHTGGII